MIKQLNQKLRAKANQGKKKKRLDGGYDINEMIARNWCTPLELQRGTQAHAIRTAKVMGRPENNKRR